MHAQTATRTRRTRWRRRLALGQGVYYAATGLWSLVDIRSFERVSGPKTDDWLVKTVGALVGVLGGGLIASALRGGPSRDLALTAAGSAAALAAVDVVYVGRDRIAPVYLLDAVAEAALVAGWALVTRVPPVTPPAAEGADDVELQVEP